MEGGPGQEAPYLPDKAPGKTCRQGWFCTWQVEAQTNAMGVTTMVTMTITMRADTEIKRRQVQVLQTQELCGHKKTTYFLVSRKSGAMSVLVSNGTEVW